MPDPAHDPLHDQSCDSLPGDPLPGCVITQFIRCNKPRCRCRLGRLHGPYYYRVWREGARVWKAYVRHADVGRVTAQCALHLELQERAHGLALTLRSLSRAITRECRRADRLIRR